MAESEPAKPIEETTAIKEEIKVEPEVEKPAETASNGVKEEPKEDSKLEISKSSIDTIQITIDDTELGDTEVRYHLYYKVFVCF